MKTSAKYFGLVVKPWAK